MIGLAQPKKVILITGASTGIGMTLGKGLMDESRYHLILTAREESLIRFADEKIFDSENLWIRRLDVLSKRDRDLLIKEINEKLGGVDVLVNNAGIAIKSVVEHLNDTEGLRQMDVNFRAPLALIRAVLPRMREKNSGQIINVSSVAGMMAMPTMSIYSASKFALEGMSEALWYEVKPWNIKVNLVQVGFVNSDGFRKAIFSRKSMSQFTKAPFDYFFHYHSMGALIESLASYTITTPESVANKIVNVIESKGSGLRISATWDAWLFGLVRKVLPRNLFQYILWKLLPSDLKRKPLKVPIFPIYRLGRLPSPKLIRESIRPRRGPQMFLPAEQGPTPVSVE